MYTLCAWLHEMYRYSETCIQQTLTEPSKSVRNKKSHWNTYFYVEHNQVVRSREVSAIYIRVR